MCFTAGLIVDSRSTFAFGQPSTCDHQSWICIVLSGPGLNDSSRVAPVEATR